MRQLNLAIDTRWTAIIGGEAIKGPTFVVEDPASETRIARVTKCTEEHVDMAVQSAHSAHASWAALPVDEREAILLRFADVIDQEREQFIELLLSESGSTITKAQFEVAKTAQLLRTAAGEVRRLYGDTFPNDKPHRMSMVIREPIGVVAAISPFNAPLALVAKMTVFAMAAGNTVVLKPSELTPISAIAFGRAALAAGVPAGVLNVVPGFGTECGEPLAKHPRVKGLSFTGSTAVGSHLGAIASASMKRLQLELGGKNPLIVLGDFDPTEAAAIACQGAFAHAGQICMASSRVIVEESIFDAFCEALKAKAESLHLGDIRDPNTVYGPLINGRAMRKVREHVQDALAHGATLLTGGNVHDGLTFQPTVILNASREARVWSEETFGPLMCVVPATSPEHALAIANDTELGLSAAVLTHHTQKALTLARGIHSGSVHIGTHSFQSDALSPIGGYGMSGVGRSGGKYSIDAFTNLKWVSIELGTTS